MATLNKRIMSSTDHWSEFTKVLAMKATFLAGMEVYD